MWAEFTVAIHRNEASGYYTTSIPKPTIDHLGKGEELRANAYKIRGGKGKGLASSRMQSRNRRRIKYVGMAIGVLILFVLWTSGYLTGVPLRLFCGHDEPCNTSTLLRVDSVSVSRTSASIQLSNPTLATLNGVALVIICMPDSSGYANCNEPVQSPFGPNGLVANFSIGPIQPKTVNMSFPSILPKGEYTIQVDVHDSITDSAAFYAKLITV